MRSSPILRTALAAALPLAASALDGKSTRYWDCCKPSCGWPGKASVSNPVYACSANFQHLSDYNTQSGCNGGSAYSCADQTPWAINDNLAYGFAATAIAGGSESSWCCACYALTFNSGPVAGKTMVVQSTSTGGDLGSNQFDLAIPGGGVGIFNGCTSQFGGIAGAQYGGITDSSQCSSLPEALQPGCLFRFNWFQNADNPTFTFKQVQCPAELVARTGCKRDDDSSFPAFSAPSGGSSQQSSSSSSAAAQSTPVSSSAANPTSSASSSSSTKCGCTKSSSTSVPSQTSSSSSGCTAQKWAQCGGTGFTGCTSCVSGTTCQVQNQWYSQCL